MCPPVIYYQINSSRTQSARESTIEFVPGVCVEHFLKVVTATVT